MIINKSTINRMSISAFKDSLLRVISVDECLAQIHVQATAGFDPNVGAYDRSVNSKVTLIITFCSNDTILLESIK